MGQLRKKIVILGAGFAGIYALKSIYRHLKNWDDFDIIIIDRNNYFIFTPLLHEVATGGVNPGDIVFPVRDIAEKSTEHYEAEVLGIDLNKKLVDTSQGQVPYDYLIVALGAQTNYFSVQGADKYTFGIKNIDEARRLKNHLIHIFDEANLELNPEKRKDILRVVFIGGGASGVELAGEVYEFMREINKEFSRIREDEMEFYLVEADDRLLPVFHKNFSDAALKILKKRGFKVFFSDPCARVSEEGITCVLTSTIKSKTVIWTSGIMPSTIPFIPEQEKQKGRILIQPVLNIKDFPEVFILGDQAAFPDQRFGLLPPTAQVAMEQGNFVGKNLARLITGKPLLPFHYFHKGELVSFSKWKAFAQIGQVRFGGPAAWLVWRFNYLFRMPTFSKKVRLFFDWILYLVSKRDIAEI
ncbi:hypothetical protein A2833_03490 [Candidatus Azambacteria bacterium RIFCSPHIGHO2_01_FULL_44_55]|nr:MAG: hypothetical protein A3A18_03065 [Candidatus Azambacteria bacterium RIFCSPLOWO2_01_FULL_44_84]OGD33678.1 MAG: hypothetical protein A3C78_01155 [Candidatus Azambacteria bacterium RIFCSPHIGHO2_02_FULL_45_18]OGD40813.1 MAG: hypothetical protein A2833_03490 [Candidatus Azambacteria bacterium RIFCSPHIGHO2_01_FULL_44_55]OGD52217.1 MAG: hypothetical protein A2608_02160 [Candidatus Azambacteria bacterium RIFOXYD1_FULL_44_10]